MSQPNDVPAQDSPAIDQPAQPEAQGVDQAMLNRRKVLKVAVLATPMLLTLRAKPVYAGGGGRKKKKDDHKDNEPDYVAYGPGAYIDDHEPDCVGCSKCQIHDYNPPYNPPKPSKPWWWPW